MGENMKKKFVLYTIITLFSLVILACRQTDNEKIIFTQEQEAWIEEHKVIKLSPDPNFAPFEFVDENGKYSGIASEYIKYINEHSNLNIEIVILDSWDEIVEQIQFKKIDLIGALSITKQREEYLLFTEPFIDSLGVIIVSDSLKTNVDLNDLEELKVAVVSQYVMNDYLEANYPKIDLIEVESVQEALKRVSFGLVDAFVENLATSSYYLKDSNVTNLRVSSRFDYDLEFRMGVRNDWPMLRDILDSSLNQIPDNEKQKINNKWISLESGLNKIYLYAVYIVGIFSVLLIVILIWNRSLKKIVKIKTQKISEELIHIAETEAELKKFNEKLEEKVERRTYLLNETNKELEKSMYKLQLKQGEVESANVQLEESIKELNEIQNRLIQSEKMAALGNLVAGVAHEINTPLGVAITAVSHIDKMTNDIIEEININKLTKRGFQHYINSIEKSTLMTIKNLEYAKNLIQKFKQVAVDQQIREKRLIVLTDYIKDVLMSLHPEIKKYDVEILIECSEKINIYTYPGAISQIITNLIINSLTHGYVENEHQIIKIIIEKEESMLKIEYSDDGNGVNLEILNNLFDPFFTTKRGSGGTGLGLNIVYNLVVDLLNGNIEAKSDGLGMGLFILINIPLKELMIEE